MTTDQEIHQFTVLYGGSGLKNEFEVHARGCRDIARKCNGGYMASYTIVGADVEAAIAADLADPDNIETGWKRDHFDYLPCAQRVTT